MSRAQLKQFFSREVDYSNVYPVTDLDVGPRGGRFYGSSYWWRFLADRDDCFCQHCHMDMHRLEKLLRKSLRVTYKSRMKNRLHNKFRWAFDWDWGGEHNVKRCLWQVDHIVPIRLGGKDSPENVRTLCIPCHQAATQKFHDHMRSLKRRGLLHD